MAKLEQGTCLWIDEVGTPKIRIFTIIGRKEGKIKIEFSQNEVFVTSQRNMRANRMVIFKVNGRVIIQNPDKWKDIDLKKHGIKELRFNLQNMAIQESRAAIHRWTLPLDKLAKLSPLIKLLLICIVVGVIGWSMFKFGTYALDLVMKSRLLECSQVLPRFTEVPIGAVTNSTPIG